MATSYRKLWKLLIDDKDMKKKDFRLSSWTSAIALTKLGKNERVMMNVIDKVNCVINYSIVGVKEMVGKKENMNGGCLDEH